jgi:hypothetical protein
MVHTPHFLAAGVFLNVFPERQDEVSHQHGLLFPPISIHQVFIFYFWGHLKSTRYAEGVNDVQGLQQQIQNVLQMTNTTPAIFQ